MSKLNISVLMSEKHITPERNKASQNVSTFSETKTKAKWLKDIFQILNIVIEIQGSDEVKNSEAKWKASAIK